jgi:branched-chain amino acid transport system permease protein
VLLGYVTTRKAGTTFAMITLGIGELVAACSLMFPGVFGGEGGVSGNRVVGKEAFLGFTWGPQVEMYGLIVLWAFACTVAMFALTQTPLGAWPMPCATTRSAPSSSATTPSACAS